MFFDDTLRELRNLRNFADQFDRIDLYSAALHNIRTYAEDRAREIFTQNAREAIAATPEFQYGPLEKRLIENLQNWEHYRVDYTGTSMTIFDEEIGGTEADLIEGQVAGWMGHTPSSRWERRFFGWKYGIYIPFESGGRVMHSMEHFPSYEEVITARLEAWVYKAPYWYFLENGNVGGAPAYPSFPGTGFIQRTRAQIPQILREAREAVLPDFEEAIEDAVREQLEKPEGVTTVYMGRVNYGFVEEGRVQVQVQTSRRAGTWYTLVVGGRFVRRIYPGAGLPTGEVFNP